MLTLWQSKLPLGKNKASQGWIDGAVRSLPLPSHWVMCGSVVFTLTCCEWDWGGGGDGELLDVYVLRRHAAHPVSVRHQSSNAVVSAIPCCLMATFSSVPFSPLPNTLQTFLMVLLWVVLSFQGVFDTISDCQTVGTEEKNMGTEEVCCTYLSRVCCMSEATRLTVITSKRRCKRNETAGKMSICSF